MATKTFKIGLSATDKQNMAQDILEQVEEMLFEEYDSTKTYNIGDYCVYSGALYRCKVDNTTGTWNSSNWDSATLQDLVDDVNDAVASVSGKADIVSLENGTLVPAKALTTEQIENVSEDSGTTQDKPFTFQATATDSGTGASDTAPVAKYIKLKGKTYAWNQLIPISAVETTTSHGITFTNNNDGSWTISGTADDNAYRFTNDNINLIANHKYLLKGNTGNGSATTFFLCAYYNADFRDKDIGNGVVITPSADTTIRIAIRVLNGTAITGSVKIIPQLIDLTQLFNGDIPTAITSGVELEDYGLSFTGVDIFNQLFPLPYYAYNTGTLVSSNATTLKTTGKNQFDGVVFDGYWDANTGAKTSNNAFKGSNDYIRVIPSQKYLLTIKGDGNGYRNILGYDKNKNFIGRFATPSSNATPIQIPSNVHYITFYMSSTIYEGEVDFFLAWLENGTTSRPEYEEYVSHTYDLGSELKTSPLLSAGNVCDEKLPNGTITRKIGVVDLASANLSWNSGTSTWESNAIASVIKKPADADTLPNIICSTIVRDTSNHAYTHPTDKAVIITSLGYIRICGFDSATTPTGTLYYELATYTPKEGTSYPENIEVDDFGTMEYGGTDYNGYPQGCEIFYPADYVLFIDSLGNATDFDASNVITKDNVATSVETYLKSLTGYDGSKTQTLKNVEGTLTWVDD